MVLATVFENHRAFDLYRLPCRSVVDLCRRGRRILNAPAAMGVGGAHNIRSSCSLPIPEHHFNVYVFFASTGLDIGYLIVFLFEGCIAAIVAKEREMAAATTLSLISAALCGTAVVSWVVQGHWALSRFTWDFADTIAILIGGAIVRTHRSAHLSHNENLPNT